MIRMNQKCIWILRKSCILVDGMEILDGQVGQKRSFMHSRRLDFVWENQHHWLDGFDDPKPELLSTQRHKSDIIS